MSERQDHQRDTGEAHEQPGVLLEVGDAPRATRRAGMVQAGRTVVLFFLHGGQPALAVVGCPGFGHRNRSAMSMPRMPRAGIITASQTPVTIHSMSRW